MSYRVFTHDVTDTPAIIPLGPVYNNIDATIEIPSGADSIWTGGEDVDTDEHGKERAPGGDFAITATSGTDIWAVADTGVTVTIKIEVND